MNERDYLRLKKQFADEYAKKVEALELIWLESSGGKKPPKEQQSEGNGSIAGARGYLATALEDFYKSWGAKEFSAKHFEDWLRRERNTSAHRTTVTHKLRRMVNDGVLGLATRGSGKRAAVYVWNVKAPEAAGSTSTPPTEEECERFREVLKQLPAQDIDEFKREVLARECGVERLIQLSRPKFDELFELYKQKLAASLAEPSTSNS